MEIESVKKIQNEGNLEMKKSRNSNRNLRGKPHQQNTRDRERSSGIEDKVEEMEMLNLKKLQEQTYKKFG